MVDVVGLVVLAVLYLTVLAVGVIAAHWFRHKHGSLSQTELALVAGRKLGGIVGIFTMIGLLI